MQPIRARSKSVQDIELKQLNKQVFKQPDNVKIHKEDLELAVNVYFKRKPMNVLRKYDISPEIRIFENIIARYPASSLFSTTQISEQDKDILIDTIVLNCANRSHKPRLTDSVIDKFIDLVGLKNHEALKYLHFDDYI